MLPEKICNACKVSKPLGDFHNKKASKDGKQEKCKPCAIARSSQRYRENAASVQVKVKIWSQNRRLRNLQAKERFLEKFNCNSCKDINSLILQEPRLARKKMYEFNGASTKSYREKLYRCKVYCSKCNTYTYNQDK